MVAQWLAMLPHSKKAVALFPALWPFCVGFYLFWLFLLGFSCFLPPNAYMWGEDKTSGFWSRLGLIAARGETNIETLISDGFAAQQRFLNWTLKDGRAEDATLRDREACGRSYDLNQKNKGIKGSLKGLVRLFEPFKELRSIKGKTPGRQLDAALVFIVGWTWKHQSQVFVLLFFEVWAWQTDGSVVGRQLCGHNSKKKKTLKTQ